MANPIACCVMDPNRLRHTRRTRNEMLAILAAASAATSLSLAYGCASTGNVASSGIVVTAGDAGETVRLAPGERMTVELFGNPSSGRVWELRALPDAAVLVPDGTRWVAANGASGSDELARTQQLRFVAQGPGRVLLVFEYVQPNSPSAKPSSFSVAVEVSTR